MTVELSRILTWTQIEFVDPDREWELVNAWFVKQNNFWATFNLRDIVQPDDDVVVEKAEH